MKVFVGCHISERTKISNCRVGLILKCLGQPTIECHILILFFGIRLAYAARLGFGWNFFWYQALTLTTGLFSPAAYFMGTAAMAVGIRFIVVSR